MDSNKAGGVVVKSEDTSKIDPSIGRIGKSPPPRSDPPATLKDPPNESTGTKDGPNAESKPLAPPPRPSQANESSDYFSAHNNSRFLEEPNPFERSFGVPSSEAPAGSQSLLPPVAALTSPAPLVGGTPNNWSSLRSGPLSPAMLGGPVGSSINEGYFDGALRGGFTPQESSLRTGLTPGGGGSMFPAPSPNSQALYQQLAGGGATPSTLDFHRTAMNAAAQRKNNTSTSANGTSAQDSRAPVATMNQAAQSQQFDQHDAANGLFLLAQAGNGAQANNQFAMPNPPSNIPNNSQAGSQETSPQMAKRVARNANGSIGGGSISGSVRGQSEMSAEDSGDQSKPATRNRGKRASTGKGAAATNGRRKAEEPPSKQPAAKKAKNSISAAQMSMDMDINGMDSDDEQNNIKEEQYHENGKKMTDEEKRKNFLERNRVAALKCRQRKKQWLANLQAKVEIFSSENDSLSAQVNAMREEIVQLKSILLQHKDCPVSQAQGLSNYFQQQQEYNNHTNPYGMAMNNQQIIAGQRS